MKKILFVLTTLGSLFTSTVQAEEIVDSVTGVTYEVDENGEFARIRAVGEAELTIGDRKDIRTATQKAQMRAKANIAKFLDERITTSEVLDEVEKQVTSHDGKNMTVDRQTLSTHMENIQNSAEALLRGVIATKTDVNLNGKYVQVEVGLSPKTVNAAGTIHKTINSSRAEDHNPASQSRSGAGVDLSHDIEGGREIKKTKNYDNF